MRLNPSFTLGVPSLRSANEVSTRSENTFYTQNGGSYTYSYTYTTTKAWFACRNT